MSNEVNVLTTNSNVPEDSYVGPRTEIAMEYTDYKSGEPFNEEIQDAIEIDRVHETARRVENERTFHTLTDHKYEIHVKCIIL